MPVDKRQKRQPRFGLRLLMLVILCLATMMTYGGYQWRRIQQANAAQEVMYAKGVDALSRGSGIEYALFFKHANVQDGDLAQFVPAFNGALRSNVRVVGLELNGSPVSPAAIRRFEHAVPDCYVKP